MKKSEVYKLIGYDGEYNASVKKAIRKLLKENHPDNHGNRETFELINEVKKELESGKKPSIKKQTTKDNSDLDYDYYYRIIEELKNKKSRLIDETNAKKQTLKDYEDEYKSLYQRNLDIENGLLANSSLIKKVKSIRTISILFLILIIIIFAIAVLKNNNILFIIFVILSIIYVILVQNNLLLVNKMAEKNKRGLANYVRMSNDIKKNVRKQNAIKKEIRDIKKQTTDVENDLRFYKNLLK